MNWASINAAAVRAILCNSTGGLIVAIALRYSSAVDKAVASSVALVMSTLVSVPLYGFQLSATFGLGAVVTILASLVFAAAPKLGSADENVGYGAVALGAATSSEELHLQDESEEEPEEEI